MPSSAPAYVFVLVGWAEFVWFLEIPLRFAGCRLFVFPFLSCAWLSWLGSCWFNKRSLILVKHRVILTAGSGILGGVSVLVLWPYNCFLQSSCVCDVWPLETCVDLG